MSDPINEYLTFLWSQMQYDVSVFSNPWILYTIIPACFYLCFFVIKWVVLLAPITIPIMTYTHGMTNVAAARSRKKSLKKEISEQLLKE